MTKLSSEKPELFKCRHFNHLLIIQAVRWYVTFKLSYRDVCDLMAERGVIEEARGVAASQRIPAIALTALAVDEERLRALSAGFQRRIAKPADPVELMVVIANIARMWPWERNGN
jgi:hypothetical protein